MSLLSQLGVVSDEELLAQSSAAKRPREFSQMRSFWYGAINRLRPEGAKANLPHLQCGINVGMFPDVSRLARFFDGFAAGHPRFGGCEKVE
ncbi:MAG TPA: hypothetical protein VNA22_05075 [Pyrinomonadaceae bacterium]|nr:hypothetical protein [Pyrinomonadaceae bacterium]